jgi:site-specific recombinase XerD
VLKKPPLKVKNVDRRPRQFLTEDEVLQLTEAAARTGRYGHRDSLLIELGYHYGLRVGEIIALEWEHVDFSNQKIVVRRLRSGAVTHHQLSPKEMDDLSKLRLAQPDSKYVFCSERRGPLTRRSVHSIVSRAGQLAAIPFPVHPQMLRYALIITLVSKGAGLSKIRKLMGHPMSKPLPEEAS